MTNLEAWLLDCIAADEEVARACVGINELAGYLNGKPIPRWVREGSQIRSDDEWRIVRVGHTWAREADHIARWDPARVLAECAAKRAIVEYAQEQWDVPFGAPEPFIPPELERVLRLLAQPYANRPGYDPAWAVE